MPEDTTFNDRTLEDPPYTEAFVMERRWLRDWQGGLENRVAYTNVPHLTCWHSPSGFEWGYGGSGPADLSLNIPEATLQHIGHDGPREKTWRDWRCFTLARVLHQDFKREVIARLPQEEGGRIPFADVVAWIEHKRAERAAEIEEELEAQAEWTRLEAEEAAEAIADGEPS
jgi:hypothetical protein